MQAVKERSFERLFQSMALCLASSMPTISPVQGMHVLRGHICTFACMLSRKAWLRVPHNPRLALSLLHALYLTCAHHALLRPIHPRQAPHQLHLAWWFDRTVCVSWRLGFKPQRLCGGFGLPGGRVGIRQ
jgi:hypothetical protein